MPCLKQRTVGVCLAFALWTALSGASATAQEKPHYGGHLTVGFSLEPTSLDPIAGRSGGDAYHWRQIDLNGPWAAGLGLLAGRSRPG